MPANQPSSSRRLFWLEADRWRIAAKTTDTLSTVFVFDPIIRFVIPLFLLARLSPNTITGVGFLISLASAYCLATDHLAWGGILFAVWYIVDCIDGKVARLTDRCTKFGWWLDVLTDRLGTAAVLGVWGGAMVLAGDSTTGFLAFGLLMIWTLACQNGESLALIRPDYQTAGIVEGGPAEGGPTESTAQESAAQESTAQESTAQESTAQESTDRESAAQAGSTAGGVRRLADRLARHRIAMPFVNDVEWLMIGIALAGITGYVQVCLIVACVGMVLQRASQTFVFWWRRRGEIANI